MTNEELHGLAVSMAHGADVDTDLVCAIVGVESSWNVWAVRYEPLYAYLETPDEWAHKAGVDTPTEIINQKMSWGLMQVMGGVARQYGFTKVLSMLCDPALGLQFGIEHLKSKIRLYGACENDVISAYNAGAPLKKDGKYKNQDYVDDVSAKLRDLRIFQKGI